jgi:hypothetical protein
VRLEGLCLLENPMISWGMKPRPSCASTSYATTSSALTETETCNGGVTWCYINCGEWGYSSAILHLNYMQLCHELHSPAALPPEKEPPVLFGPHRRSGWYREPIFSLTRIEPMPYSPQYLAMPNDVNRH